jgi:hypothetical protein
VLLLRCPDSFFDTLYTYSFVERYILVYGEGGVMSHPFDLVAPQAAAAALDEEDDEPY